jgi:hypothetical protein
MSLVVLLAFLGCVPVFSGTALAEQSLKNHPFILDTFSGDEEEPEDETEPCSACYPLPE